MSTASYQVGATFAGSSTTQKKWSIVDVSLITDPKLRRLVHRLNCLGSCYYFIKVGLQRHRLYDPLHEYMAHYIEREYLKEVIEIPRDHFKTTIYSEGAPMWWALPFNDSDEQYMRALGYGDEWIRWMNIAHDRDTTTCIVSENIKNASKIGRRIRHHYENTRMFKELFPEVQPDSSCIWGSESLEHKRTGKSPDGEGTYDFLSVGAALQSRHYKRIVQDDLVGRDALNSEAVMMDTIEYHRILPGAWDSDPRLCGHENDEIVVGNRWKLNDLNSWIKANEPNFRFVTHSALGGCCNLHPAGQVIFPTEWTVEKLHSLIPRWGLRDFSCQYLNNPVAEGTKLFDEQWLRYYKLERMDDTIPLGASREPDPRAVIVHEVMEGEVVENILPTKLSLFMVCDPNHAGNLGRTRHAITVTGVRRNPLRVYLLDVWAESCTYEKLVNQIYKMAEYWKLRRFWLETVAAQKYLKFYLDERNKRELRKLSVIPLKIDTNANAKGTRIESMNPIYAEGNFWLRRTAHQEFVKEYGNYTGMAHGKPVSGHTVDILDTLGYGPQIWDGRVSTSEEMQLFMTRMNQNAPENYTNLGGY